ncbi:MAG: hypothetical protein WAL66_03590 [Nitrososphaeraceae archaeon]
MAYFYGTYITYRIVIYYESDQGPLPLGLAVPKMLETGNSNITNQVRNIEAEQHVLLDDGTFVNTESEMCRIENESRYAKLHSSQREQSNDGPSSSGDINHPKLPPSHISGIDLRSGSNRLLESVPELVDSNYLLEKSGENRNVNIKQKSLLEFIG